jgi:hypothetical protein
MRENDMERLALPNAPRTWSRRAVFLALANISLAVPACAWSDWFAWNGGKPVLFGYRTAPNYDTRIKTVRVKIFKDPTFWAVVPVPGLEMQLTQALVRQIEQTTPYKVVSGDADTEISGSIRSFLKLPLNYTQQNEQRDVETDLIVDVVWRNLRTGELLSVPAQRAIDPLPPAGLLPGQQDPLNAPGNVPGAVQAPLITAPLSPANQQATMAGGASPPPIAGNPFLGATNAPGAPGAPPGGTGPAAPVFGVLVRSVATYKPELGQSISTAQQDNVNRMAQRIVEMMEVPW